MAASALLLASLFLVWFLALALSLVLFLALFLVHVRGPVDPNLRRAHTSARLGKGGWKRHTSMILALALALAQ